ncbi:unnamed protein product [Ectocarpus fasciculatus]
MYLRSSTVVGGCFLSCPSATLAALTSQFCRKTVVEPPGLMGWIASWSALYGRQEINAWGLLGVIWGGGEEKHLIECLAYECSCSTPGEVLECYWCALLPRVSSL